MKKTKVVCTMGPNTNDRELMKNLILNGMDVARFNFSHGDHEEQKSRMDLLKQLREELHTNTAILLDTKGPEIRTGKLKDGKKVILENGASFTLTTEEIIGDETKVSITYTGLPEDVDKGSTILIDDGLIGLKVVSKTEDNKYYFITMQGIMVSYDCIYLRVDQMVFDNANLNAGSENTTKHVEINLSTRKERTLIQFDSTKESWTIVGGNGKCLMITKYIPNNSDISQGIDALYRMNLDDLSHEVIIDGEMLSYSDLSGNINADNLLTYCTEHEIHLYDLDTGEDKLLYQINNTIIRTNIFGNDVFYIFSDSDNRYHFMRGNTAGNTAIEMKNNGYTDGTAFGCYRTTENGYLGLIHDGQFGWLSQEDYYQENYDGFVPLR